MSQRSLKVPWCSPPPTDLKIGLQASKKWPQKDLKDWFELQGAETPCFRVSLDLSIWKGPKGVSQEGRVLIPPYRFKNRAPGIQKWTKNELKDWFELQGAEAPCFAIKSDFFSTFAGFNNPTTDPPNDLTKFDFAIPATNPENDLREFYREL